VRLSIDRYALTLCAGTKAIDKAPHSVYTPNINSTACGTHSNMIGFVCQKTDSDSRPAFGLRDLVSE